MSPNERVHITVKPASAAWWASEPPVVKGVVHVYSVNYITANGFESYLIHSTSKTKYGSGTWATAVRNAMAKQYTQKSSTKAKDSSSKSHGSSSRSQGSSSKSQGSGSKSRGSKSEEQPAGYFENGVPYYYSESQKTYYYIGSDGKGHSC